MEDTNNRNNESNAKTTSFLLPPGCRFQPSEEQLLCYYLNNKNANADETGSSYRCDLIKELDLYEYEPHELPEKACYAYGYRGRKTHWYCYCKVRVGNGRKVRRAKKGYWRSKGKVREVVKNNSKGGKVVLGSKRSFEFYSGNSLKTAVRTDWVMHEYALVHHVKTSFVLCRVFVKSNGGNSISEIGLSSVAEESVSAVHHMGVQSGGFLTPNFVKAKVDDEKSVDRKNDTSNKLMTSDNHVCSGQPVSVARSQCAMGNPPNERVSTSGLTSGGIFVDTVAAEQLLSIIDEDFIELDDLVH